LNPKVNYMLVGLFVLIMGTGMLTTVIWLSAAVEDRSYETYATYYTESVSGLKQNAAVTYLGVEVGKVVEIALDQEDPGRVRVLLDIEEDTPVTEDTVAILRQQGITGLAHVELTGGSLDSRNLQIRGGEEYPVIQTGPSLFVRLDQAVTTIIDQLTDTAKNLDQVAERVQLLLSDENQQAIAGTLQNVESLTGGLDSRAAELAASTERLEQILTNTALASDDWPDLVAQVRRVLDTGETALANVYDAATGVDEAAASLDATAVTAGEVLVDARRDVSAFTHNTPAQVELLIFELQQVSESFRRLSLDLERDPNMLLFGRPQAEPGPGE